MKAPLALVCLLAPATASGQAAVTGFVGDSSGAALPKVTVEASSASLIEKTRVVVSDVSGRYRIEELRPGTYQVTCARWLPDLSATRIELAGFSRPSSTRASTSALRTPFTVTATSPLVDVRRPHEITPNGDSVKSRPPRAATTRCCHHPGVVTATNDTVSGTATTAFSIRRPRAGRAADGRRRTWEAHSRKHCRQLRDRHHRSGRSDVLVALVDGEAEPPDWS
jgi:hypothetical protein